MSVGWVFGCLECHVSVCILSLLGEKQDNIQIGASEDAAHTSIIICPCGLIEGRLDPRDDLLLTCILSTSRIVVVAAVDRLVFDTTT